MEAKNLLFSTVVVLSAVVGVSGAAQAATFTTDFDPNPADPKKDITLERITQNGRFATSFNVVQSANIRSNTGLTLGGTSTDKGDEATSPNGVDPAEFPTNEQLATYLGNTNLNNIADTEDDGTFEIDLTFEDVIAESPGGRDSLFFWERGLNSDITVQALDGSGNLIGNSFTITRDLWANAGYSIDTTEVTSSQPVGSYGVSFADLGLSGTTFSSIRLTSLTSFNGPDFKVVSANLTGVVPTPEPVTILGLGSVAALALVRRRQMKKGSSLK